MLFRSRMKRRVISIALAVPVFYLVTFGVLVGVTAVHAKSYAEVLTGEYDKASIMKDSANLARDVDRVMWMAQLPIAKQIAAVVGLDFTPIRDEISAVIEASSWLAGADAPKRYMIAFQNSAEARGTGGILGAFAIIEMNKASLTVVRTGSNAVLYSSKDVPVSVPAEFTKL